MTVQSNVRKRRSRRTAVLLALSAVVLASGLTYQTSHWPNWKQLNRDRSYRVAYGTMYLTELIDKDKRLNDVEDTRGDLFLGVPSDYDSNEWTREFCRRVHEQALKYRHSDLRHDVWCAEMGRGPLGWPLIVDARIHLVCMEQDLDAKGGYRIDQFWLDDLGEPSFRPWGLIGNALFYLLAMLLLVEAAYRAARGVWRRFIKAPQGCCSFCGYNLTGNVSGICPECGHAIHITRA